MLLPFLLCLKLELYWRPGDLEGKIVMNLGTVVVGRATKQVQAHTPRCEPTACYVAFKCVDKSRLSGALRTDNEGISRHQRWSQGWVTVWVRYSKF